MFRRFNNVFPYAEEVIMIDRSKLRLKPSDVIMESYIDFGFKQEMTRLYVLGFMLKRQLLNPDATKAFEPFKDQYQFFNHLFKYKSLKECSFMSKLIESSWK